MQQRLARPRGRSQLSLISRVNSDNKVVASSDVYVSMAQGDNADGFSVTEDNTPMFEKFTSPDTPPPPPPRSDLPLRPELPSRSPPVRSKPPPIPPRSGTSSPPECQPKPPKPLPRYKRDVPAQDIVETHAKPPVMPRIIRRLSQRYSQRRRQNGKIPPESYEAFLTDEEL